MDRTARQKSVAQSFRALHDHGCFVLPNPWDIGSAIYLAKMGFQALATTSAGISFSRGLPDDTSALPLDIMLAHFREIADATMLPVNADFQSGYAEDAAGVAENVSRCIATGAAGLSIEDYTGRSDAPLFARESAIDRIRAARAAIDSSGIPVVLTGRCESWLVGDADPLRCALDRLTSYAEAGADCLYAPGVEDGGEIAALVKAVSPKPLNVLMHGALSGWSVSRFADLGVRRVSVGSALARAAWGGFLRAAKGIIERGTFDGFEGATPFSELNEAFREWPREN